MKNPTIFSKVFLCLFIASTAMADGDLKKSSKKSGAISDEMAKKIFINMRKCTLEAEATGASAIMEKNLNQHFVPSAEQAKMANEGAAMVNKLSLAQGVGAATSAAYGAFYLKFHKRAGFRESISPNKAENISSMSATSLAAMAFASPATGNIYREANEGARIANEKVARDIELNKTEIQKETKKLAKELGYMFGISKTDEALLQDALYRRAVGIDKSNEEEKFGDFLKNLKFGKKSLLSGEQKNALDTMMKLEDASRDKAVAPDIEDAKVVPYLKACVNALEIKNAQAANKRTDKTAREVSDFLSELSTYARLNKLPDYYDTKKAEHNAEEAHEAGKNMRAD